jgi:hypothetical protein
MLNGWLFMRAKIRPQDSLDRGVQDESPDYLIELEFYGFQFSMSTKVNPFDWTLAESFIKTL